VIPGIAGIHNILTIQGVEEVFILTGCIPFFALQASDFAFSYDGTSRRASWFQSALVRYYGFLIFSVKVPNNFLSSRVMLSSVWARGFSPASGQKTASLNK
jgi:hypothetical protein